MPGMSDGRRNIRRLFTSSTELKKCPSELDGDIYFNDLPKPLSYRCGTGEIAHDITIASRLHQSDAP
jgi:hypothetical protein